MKLLKSISPSVLFGSYIIVAILLFLYSFTQVDLGLTLTRLSIWQTIQKLFQYIGYFNRPLSGTLYLIILFLLFGFYFLILATVKNKKVKKPAVWKPIIISSVFFALSYNAFSYDLFNYVFDAKIVTYYHQNPYEHKALDYPGDPMLGFMHWTHRTYPYGPIWLLLSIPISYLGFHSLLLTLILFKMLAAGCFLGTTYYIGKIYKKLNPQFELFSMLFFALNPLVIIESLVSAHNDIVMMFLTLAAFYTLLSKKHAFAILLLLLAIGVKFASVFLLPIFLFIIILQKRNKTINWEKMFFAATVFMLLAVFAAILRPIIQEGKFDLITLQASFQPWYLLNVLPVAALVAYKKIMVFPVFILSLAALLTYVQFLYVGQWTVQQINANFQLEILGLVIALLIPFVLFVRKKFIN